MLPIFNSLPYNSNQIQLNGTIAPAAQVMPQENQSNLLPNSIGPPQMGMVNPQISNPFSNFNTHLCNGIATMPDRSILTPSPGFMNVPNHLFSLQNGVSLLASNGVMPHPNQCQGRFVPQNLNSITAAVPNMNGMNPLQPSGQLFHHHSMNLPQYFNQNAVLPNGQFGLQSITQNMSQFVQPQMSNYGQGVPYNFSPQPNQIFQAMGPQKPNYIANLQSGVMHSNGAVHPHNEDQHNLARSTVDVNASKHSHNTTQQVPGTSSLPHASASVQLQQAQNNFQHPVFSNSQGNPGKDGRINKLNANWNNSQNRNFAKNQMRDATPKGSHKSQFHHRQNAKGKFGIHNKHGGKGFKNERARKSGDANSCNQTWVEQRRPHSLSYTEQEIKQWREERRKNYPSKVNMKKKLMEPEITDRCSKLRRQQLKEILAKQAELGCEVAEVPSCYLSDSEKKVDASAENRSLARDNFRNKLNRRGKFRRNDQLADQNPRDMVDQNNHFSKKQRLQDDGSPTRSALNKREPTLLQKLLSSDIRRDKNRLAQVCRFIMMNSFFKDWPEKPLRFPVVTVKESGCEGEVVEKEPSDMGRGGVSEGSDKTKVEANEDVNDGGDNDGNKGVENEHNSLVEETADCTTSEGSFEEHVEGEEGEIID